MDDRDPEIAAIEAVVGALAGLDDEARDRVMAYVRQRLGLPNVPDRGPDAPAEQKAHKGAASGIPPGITDIRTLREEKQPGTANEMAAIVAYYLGELAPSDERTEEVTTAHLEKYFKQASHPLPTGIRFTLKNAAAAGYFDALGGGQYKLNPVGYNLVAHGLPAGTHTSGSRRSASTKRAAGKKGGKRTAPAKKSSRAR